jgi:hypothetical protein
MPGLIYLIQSDKSLEALQERPYDSEDLLQSLLADYPSLLAGEQMSDEAPRRWVLVAREMGVPTEPGGGSQWSLDHLFLDQDGVPTLVEVKRSKDTRIRREVVGQMLDYAANAAACWPPATIREQFEEMARNRERDPEAEIVQHVQASPDDAEAVEKFWQGVGTNLLAGRIRMVFVADQIPAELRRIVEFLNGQMWPAEVFAVEVKQFTGKGVRTLVPRVYGHTQGDKRPRSSDGLPAPRQWDEESFLADMSQKQGPQQTEVARQILTWVRQQGLGVRWGKGGHSGSFYAVLARSGVDYNPFGVRTLRRAYVEVGFGSYQRTPGPASKPPLLDRDAREGLRQRLNLIPGVSIAASSLDKWPSIFLETLAEAGALPRFFEAFDWMIKVVQTRES